MMHSVVTLLAIVVIVIAPNVIRAQQARIGRLPILELPPSGIGACRTDPVSAALRRDGITRLITFTSSDSLGHQITSLGMDATRRPVFLMTMMGTRQERRGESESVSVFFGKEGMVVHGRRSASTTGTPSRLSDDRNVPLLPSDTVKARRLANALRQRCGG